MFDKSKFSHDTEAFCQMPLCTSSPLIWNYQEEKNLRKFAILNRKHPALFMREFFHCGGGQWGGGFKHGVTNRSQSMIGKLIDKSIKSILLDNNRLISLKNRTKSIITKY